MTLTTQTKRPVVAVDFDGTIAEYENWHKHGETPGDAFVGAVEFLKAIYKQYDIVIWSARCASPSGRDKILEWLRERKLMGIIKDVSCVHKGFDVVMIVDDRARRCNGNEHYEEILRELGV